MTDRILDIAASPAFLRRRNDLLVIEVEGIEMETIPFAELACVVVSNRQAMFTQAAVSGLAEAGVSLVTCDERYVPSGMLLPMVGHYMQADRFAKQAALSTVKKKRWWQAIVKAKIVAQAQTLELLRGMDFGLRPMAARVGSGDPTNVESQAARRYWTLIFEDATFRRRDEDARNALLNYGYAVLRAATVRALTASGLHPTFSLHHHNKSNPFGLGDDVMEPYRPMVDRVVVEIANEEESLDLRPAIKRRVLGSLTARYDVDGEQRTMFDILCKTAQGLAAAVMNNDLNWKPANWRFVE